MFKRTKKKNPINFGVYLGYSPCPDYPRCARCTEFDTCDECDAPICVWEVGGYFESKNVSPFLLLCKECREIDENIYIREADDGSKGHFILPEEEAGNDLQILHRMVL